MQQELVQAQKLESIGQLSAGIAHEINTPAQYISDNISFLKDSFGELLDMVSWISTSFAKGAGIDNAKLRDMVEKADIEFLQQEIPKAINDSAEGIDRVTKIVRALKEFSHPSTEKSPEDINRAIESTATVARNEWKYVADLVIDADENLQQVPCVLNEINQVMLNLIVNAAHAIRDVVGNDGGKGTITIRTRQRDACAEIQVEDTGAGIPEGIRDRIFDPFFTTKDVGQGTGQGLSIARNVIVDKHGGTISVESGPGRGTRFTICLPTDSTASDEEQSAAA
jgi:signal transduction histidine kinase